MIADVSGYLLSHEAAVKFSPLLGCLFFVEAAPCVFSTVAEPLLWYVTLAVLSIRPRSRTDFRSLFKSQRQAGRMASSRKRPIHETMHSVDGDRCSVARRLVKLRGLSLPANTSVGITCLAAMCTRLTRLESVRHLRSLTAVTADLRLLKQLRRIDFFLSSCTSLTSVDLSGMPQLTTIGDSFLSGCTSVVCVDLSGMLQLTTIGDFLLLWCTSVTSVDFSGMTQLTTIGDSFLSGCTSVVCVDFSGMPQLTTIGDFFLSACTSLGNVDFSRMPQLTSIGDCFLSWCTSLTTVDLSRLLQLTMIGDRMMHACHPSRVKAVGASFGLLENCTF